MRQAGQHSTNCNLSTGTYVNFVGVGMVYIYGLLGFQTYMNLM